MSKVENITRQKLYNLVFQELGLSKISCSAFVDTLFDSLITNLKKNKKVKIALFGSFSKKSKRSRVGRNPKTKEEKTISSRNVVTFKASKLLIKKINRFNA